MSRAGSNVAYNSVTKLPAFAPSYSLLTSLEANYDGQQWFQWLGNNVHIPLIICLGVYLPVLYFGQKVMANREPIKAKGALALWNTGLAAFSIVGFSRTFPEFLHVFNKFGYEYTICNNSYAKVGPAALWIYLFVLSKIPELVDTFFLVLRKQKLIFLHVYHHASVAIFAWCVLANQLGTARWFCNMNYGVHSIMYTYYALKAFPNLIRIPRWVSMLITTMQTLQMVAGTYVVVSAAYLQVLGKECAGNTPMTIFSLIIYVSYLILFSHFFYKAYCSPAPPRRDDKKRA